MPATFAAAPHRADGLAATPALIDRAGPTQQGLSPVAARVYQLVDAMECAFFAGSYVRVRTILFHKRPPATDPAWLLEHLHATPTAGWSCWDLSVALAALLRADGIDAGVTATIGAEPGAPAEPHALVRVNDGPGLLADPYFGIGALRANGTWAGPTSWASVVSQPQRGQAELLTLRHKAYARRYGYNILPGHLTGAQLDAMAWQALDYGDLTRHLRAGGAFRLIRRGERNAELRAFPPGCTQGPPHVTHGDFHQLHEQMVDATARHRQQALDFLFGGR